MDVLDAIAKRFADELDAELMQSQAHNQASAQFHEYCDQNLPHQQAMELDALFGKLSSAIYNSAIKSGMKLGARITAALLTNGGDSRV
ncbi:MAG: hypothetical protein IJ874_09825 [Ruminococcus sp.]|nr:hypothetical protein [Ruminococcus sp.]